MREVCVFRNSVNLTGPEDMVIIKYCVFSKNLRPLPRKDRAAIGCTENDQPIRVTVHSDLKSY